MTGGKLYAAPMRYNLARGPGMESLKKHGAAKKIDECSLRVANGRRSSPKMRPRIPDDNARDRFKGPHIATCSVVPLPSVQQCVQCPVSTTTHYPLPHYSLPTTTHSLCCGSWIRRCIDSVETGAERSFFGYVPCTVEECVHVCVNLPGTVNVRQE